MNIKQLVFSLLVSCAATAVAQETFRFGTNVNPDGVKFEVDSRGFIIGGKHVRDSEDAGWWHHHPFHVCLLDLS